MPKGFVKSSAPPMIGSTPTPPPPTGPTPSLPTPTPTTPAHPHSAQPAVLPAPVGPAPARSIAKHPPPHLAKDGSPPKQAKYKSFPAAASLAQPQGPACALAPGQPAQSGVPLAQPAPQRAQSPCAAAAQPAQFAQVAYDAAIQQAQQTGIVVEEREERRPKLIEEVTCSTDLDWDYIPSPCST